MILPGVGLVPVAVSPRRCHGARVTEIRRSIGDKEGPVQNSKASASHLLPPCDTRKPSRCVRQVDAKLCEMAIFLCARTQQPMRCYIGRNAY